MNLQEQINRTKTLMGLKPLNEGIFKQKGKLKDILGKLFKRKDSEEEVINQVNQYEQKYGITMGNEVYVDGITLLKRTNTQYDSNSADSENVLIQISVLTDTPVALPSDKTKKSSRTSYLITFEKTAGDNITKSYHYFKCFYFIDGQQTDEISQVREGQNYTCSTNTLEGRSGGCTLSQEVRDEMLKSFESDKDFTQLQSYLDKIK